MASKAAGKTAIVVGGGPAGASAAFRLQQAGVAVRLVERDARGGGRTRSERIDGFIVDIAAGLLPGTYKAVYRLMEDSGLHNALEPMLSPTAVMRDGQLHYLDLANMAGSMLKTDLLSFRSKLMLAKVGVKALGMWSSLGFDNLAKSAPYDTQSIEDYAKQSLNQELYDYLINPTEKIMYTMQGSEASVVDFFWCSKNLMSPTAFCIKGGMDRIVGNVAEQLPVSVNTEVLAVTEIGDQVEVKLRSADAGESTELVDFCVIATPARDVPKIDRGLSEASSRYLSKLRYSMLTDLHLRLKRRPDEKAVLIMVPNSVDVDLCGILIDHNKGSDRAPAGKGALSAYFTDHYAQSAYGWSDEEIYRQGLEKIEKLMPGIGALVEGYHVQRWDYAATVSYPGYYKELAGFVEGAHRCVTDCSHCRTAGRRLRTSAAYRCARYRGVQYSGISS